MKIKWLDDFFLFKLVDLDESEVSDVFKGEHLFCKNIISHYFSQENQVTYKMSLLAKFPKTN